MLNASCGLGGAAEVTRTPPGLMTAWLLHLSMFAGREEHRKSLAEQEYSHDSSEVARLALEADPGGSAILQRERKCRAGEGGRTAPTPVRRAGLGEGGARGDGDSDSEGRRGR